MNLTDEVSPSIILVDNSAYDFEADLKCLVCSKTVQIDDRNHFDIYSDTTSHSNLPLNESLRKILEEDISQRRTSSRLICKRCFSLVDNWEDITMQARNIQQTLKKLISKQDFCHEFGAINEHEQIYILSEPAIVDDQSISTSKDIRTQSKEHHSDDPDFEPYPIYTKKRQTIKRSFSKRRGRPPLKNKNRLQSERITNVNDDVLEISSAHIDNAHDFLNQNIIYFTENDYSLQSCDSCKFKTNSLDELNEHLSKHECSLCNLFLTLPSQLPNHYKSVHGIDMIVENQKKFICKLCNKEYASAGSLHNHIVATHSNNQYVCSECSLTFKHPKNLAIHKVRHGEKKVNCQECPAKFFHKTELNKHINQVHRKCRPYVCHVCNKSFCQRTVLNHHMAMHQHHSSRPA